MSLKKILAGFDDWRAANRAMTLITVIETEGSTYSKTGHRTLVAGNGDYIGLVSGGCLEGDLATRAETVLRTGEPETLTYDLRDEADALFGLGIGCEGVIRVLMQPVGPANGFEPMQSLAAMHRTATGGISAVVIADPAGEALGATFACSSAGEWNWSMPDAVLAGIRAACQATRASELPRRADGPGGLTVLYAPVPPLPRLLVLGTGPDAIPLIVMADELGWQVTAVDHRPAYVERLPGLPGTASICRPVADLPGGLRLADFDAAIVMSHHLESDRAYLQLLSHSTIPYIGLLGPPARRQRLLDELQPADPDFARRVHGPAGIELGANSPESIALAILAQIHLLRHTNNE